MLVHIGGQGVGQHRLRDHTLLHVELDTLARLAIEGDLVAIREVNEVEVVGMVRVHLDRLDRLVCKIGVHELLCLLRELVKLHRVRGRTCHPSRSGTEQRQ